MLKVLIGCECSGEIRRAVTALGHFAISVDLQPADDGAPEYFHPMGYARSMFPLGAHHTGDLFEFLERYKAQRIEMHGWFDLGIFHPECTYLTNSGALWLYKKDSNVIPLKGKPRLAAMREAAKFYNRCFKVDIPCVAVENPIMHKHAAALVGGRATQYVQPYHFGSKAMKATGWRLRNLPVLVHTHDLKPPKDPKERAKWAIVHRASPSMGREARSKFRSKTDPAIARAVADQWCQAAAERSL